MLSNARGSTPILFLITDGAVEDERQICDLMRNHLKDGESKRLRIFTFGIGNYQEAFSRNSSTLIRSSKQLFLISDDFIILLILF